MEFFFFSSSDEVLGQFWHCRTVVKNSACVRESSMYKFKNWIKTGVCPQNMMLEIPDLKESRDLAQVTLSGSWFHRRIPDG